MAGLAALGIIAPLSDFRRESRDNKQTRKDHDVVFVTIKLDTGGYWGLMFVIAVPGVLAAQKNGYHVRVVLGLLESSCNYGGVRNGMTM